MGWIRLLTAPTFLSFFIRSINIRTESGPKSTSPSTDKTKVFSAYESQIINHFEQPD